MHKNLGTIIAVATILLSSIYIVVANSKTSDPESKQAESIVAEPQVPLSLQQSGLDVDFSNSLIDLQQVISGGPGKDVIPAISNPIFVSTTEATVAGDTQVIVVEHEGEQKIYPFNILVWHEIVNDAVGGKPLAITFCPLCGSAIVYDREISGGEVEFGVSGFLYESNLLMYDRNEDESLWSQSRGEAVVGKRASEKLMHFPFELLTFAEATEIYPESMVLSEQTGYERDYKHNPYSGYADTEETSFSVSVVDDTYPAKEVFYIVPLQGTSIAVRQDKADGIYQVPGSDVVVVVDKGRYTATWGDAILPGYYEMWFSWIAHHQADGEVL